MVEDEVVDSGAAHVARAVGVQDGAVDLVDDGDGQSGLAEVDDRDRGMLGDLAGVPKIGEGGGGLGHEMHAVPLPADGAADRMRLLRRPVRDSERVGCGGVGRNLGGHQRDGGTDQVAEVGVRLIGGQVTELDVLRTVGGGGDEGGPDTGRTGRHPQGHTHLTHPLTFSTRDLLSLSERPVQRGIPAR